MAVAAGAAWAVGGLNAVETLGYTALRAVPVAALVVGLLLLLRAVTPRGPVLGPLVLVGVGALWLAIQLDLLPADAGARVLPVVLIAGGILVAMSERASEDPLASIVSRRNSVFVPRRWTLAGPAPHKLIVRCLFGDVVLDLGRATFPLSTGSTMVRRLTIDLTVLGGWTEIRLPEAWPVRAGRVTLARRMTFVGELTSSIRAAEEPEDADEENLVVLNIQGWGGRVILNRVP